MSAATAAGRRRARTGRPLLDDGTVVEAANVVWCTGFRQAFDWIEVPVFGADGWPEEYRGVVERAPGLFFCGLSFQFAFSSMVLPGSAGTRSTSRRPDRRTHGGRRPPRDRSPRRRAPSQGKVVRDGCRRRPREGTRRLREA